MKIKVTYDTNTLATASADFYSAVDHVVNLLDGTFTNPAINPAINPATNAATIAGGSGGSIVMGQAGSQQIVAGSGPTTVFGAAGDTLSAGSAALLAIIDHAVGISDGAAGRATITGFSQISGDRLSIANENSAAIDSIAASAHTSGGNTVITLPDGSTMTLVGITKIDSTFFV